MISWLSRLRVWIALDDDVPAGRAPGREGAPADEHHAYAEAAARVVRGLRTEVPRPPLPSSLHVSIMRAVRGARQPWAKAETRPWQALRWSPALACLSLAAVTLATCLLAFYPRPERTQAGTDELSHVFGAAETALRAGGQIPTNASVVMLGPIERELEQLNRDLNSTATLLLASLP